MEVPVDPVCILFADGKEEAERQVKQLCTRILPGWADLALADMQVSPISGGISNLLVKVDPPAPLHPVAVKVFGDKTELLIDRAAERQLLLRLNTVGFGAPVIGLFENGRIESFLVAKTLTPDEVADPRFIPYIARRVRTFHELHLNGAVAAAGAAAAGAVPPATATVAAVAQAADGMPAEAQQQQQQDEQQRLPSHWDAIFGWLVMAEALSFPHDAAKQAVYDKVDFRTVRQEIEELRVMCERVGSPRVLCHNDLLPGNMLILQQEQQQDGQQGADGPQQGAGEQEGEFKQAVGTSQAETARQSSEGPQAAGGSECGCSGQPTTAAAAHGKGEGEGELEASLRLLRAGSLQFIDFEYSCYGPRGFDFGNHFNEYAGFDCDYNRFPSPEQQKIFFRHYLRPGELQQLAQQHRTAGKQAGTAAAATTAAMAADGPAAVDGVIVGDGTPDAATSLAAAEEAVLDRMVAEACVYALMSHAYWVVWSYIQARYSPIDFDYLSYARMRWAEFHRRKPEFFALVDRAFPPLQ